MIYCNKEKITMPNTRNRGSRGAQQRAPKQKKSQAKRQPPAQPVGKAAKEPNVPKAPRKPKQPNITKHGTLDGQQVRVEGYKELEKYNLLVIKNDELSNKIKLLYEDNVWDMMNSFTDLKDYMREMGNVGRIAWENDIQYLDFPGTPPQPLNKVSSKSMQDGEYVSLFTDKKPNSVETDKTYAKRIKYFTNEIESLRQFKDVDDLGWIIKNNRLLMYEIMNHHNKKGNTVASINRDFKALVRIIKLLMNDEHELRYKFAALQMALTDLENIRDDLNKIRSKHEIKNFVPYEQLLEICDKLHDDYQMEYNKLRKDIQVDGKKHPPALFHKHMLHLALAINVWDFPSRLEKYKMDFISSEEEIESNMNYILITPEEMEMNNNRDCNITVVFNEVVKEHKPIRYIMRSSMLDQYNVRLCKLLKFSVTTYPRPHLFVNRYSFARGKMDKIAPNTVSNWLADIVPNKNIGIDVLRSAFVSYYFPKINNRQRQIMKIRMRTSTDVMLRSYLKFYTNPNDLVNVKIEPGADLIERTNRGTNDENRIVIDDGIREDDINEEYSNDIDNAGNGTDEIGEPAIRGENIPPLKERNRINFRKWYDNSENKEKKKTVLKDPKTYARRYVNGLNDGKLDFDKMISLTKQKYKLKVRDDGIFYSELL